MMICTIIASFIFNGVNFKLSSSGSSSWKLTQYVQCCHRVIFLRGSTFYLTPVNIDEQNDSFSISNTMHMFILCIWSFHTAVQYRFKSQLIIYINNLKKYCKIPIINNTIKIYCNGIILTKAGSKIQGIVVNTIKVTGYITMTHLLSKLISNRFMKVTYKWTEEVET
jgi:hypothetical protein